MSAFANLTNPFSSKGKNNNNNNINNNNGNKSNSNNNNNGNVNRGGFRGGRGSNTGFRGSGRGKRGGLGNSGRGRSNFTQNNPFQKKQAPTKQQIDQNQVTEPGFKPRNYEQRQTPAFLLPGQSSVFNVYYQKDDWDAENQQNMIAVEENEGSMQWKYETLQEMRETEREEMEARNRVDRQDVRKDLKDAISFVGSCEMMCPVFERVRRTYENNVKSLEKDVNGKVTKETAVKAFSRPAAGQPPPLPSDVRPPHVLKQTLSYMLNNGLDKLPSSHSFLWDRTRSIRQDFTYQNYAGDEAVDCNELIARVHIVCLHVMAGSDQEYSKQQELEQFNKTLQTLSECYSERRQKGLPDSPREAEIKCYQLLSHLRDPDIERQVQNLPERIINSAEVQLALELRALIQQNGLNHKSTENSANFFGVFFHKLKTQAKFLVSALLESNINEFRLLSLKSLGRACHARAKPYALERLTEMLAFDDIDEAREFCEYYKLPIKDETNVEISAYNDQTVSEQTPKNQPCSGFITAKLEGRSLLDVVINGDIYSKENRERGSSISISLPSVPKPTPFVSKSLLQSQQQQQQQQQQSVPKQQPQSLFQTAAAAPLPTTQAINAGAFGSNINNKNNVNTNIFSPAKKEDTINEQPKSATIATGQVDGKEKVTKEEPPKPVEAAPPKPKVTQQHVDTVWNDMIKQVTKQLIRDESIPTSFEQMKKTRQLRTKFIDLHANKLCNSLVQSLIKEQVLLSMATKFDKNRLFKNVIRLVGSSASIAKEKKDQREKWRQEAEQVAKQLGRRSSYYSAKKSNNKKRKSAISTIEAVEKTQQKEEELWKPINFDKFLSSLEQMYRRKRLFDRTLIISVFCDDWNNNRRGEWVRTKLSMIPKGKSYESCFEKNDTVIKFKTLTNNQKLFEETGALIFECGIYELSVDSERLKEILQCLGQSNYLVDVLFLYYGNLSEGDFRNVINYGKGFFCTRENFEQNVGKLIYSYTAELSSTGKQRQEEIAKERQLATERRKQLEKQKTELEAQKLEDERYKQLSRYKYLQSQSPVPPLAKYPVPKVPVALPPQTTQQVKRSYVETTTPVPKSIQALNDMVSSVTSKRHKT